MRIPLLEPMIPNDDPNLAGNSQSAIRRRGTRADTVAAAHWAGVGHEVSLITLSDSSTDSYPLPSTVRRFGLNLIRASKLPWDPIINNSRRIKAIRSAFQKSDPEVIISFTEKSNVLTILASRGLGARTIIAERADPRHHPISFIWSYLRRKTYPKADLLVVQTASVAAYCRYTFHTGEGNSQSCSDGQGASLPCGNAAQKASGGRSAGSPQGIQIARHHFFASGSRIDGVGHADCRRRSATRETRGARRPTQSERSGRTFGMESGHFAGILGSRSVRAQFRIRRVPKRVTGGDGTWSGGGELRLRVRSARYHSSRGGRALVKAGDTRRSLSVHCVR